MAPALSSQAADRLSTVPDGTFPLRVAETSPSYPVVPAQGEPHAYVDEVAVMTARSPASQPPTVTETAVLVALAHESVHRAVTAWVSPGASDTGSAVREYVPPGKWTVKPTTTPVAMCAEA
jgi:rare lipoprotein A (peptidoglycan hydrolase)